MKKLNKVSLILWFCLAYYYSTEAQSSINNGLKVLSDEEKIAINTSIQFTNESIHGLLIAHRIFENLNQKLNEQVDLETHIYNFYTNKDLPKNIFKDEDHWFYEKTPYELYDQFILQSKNLSTPNQKIIGIVKALKQYIDQINNQRFEIERLLSVANKEDVNSLSKIYQQLEYTKELYDQYHKTNLALEEIVQKLRQTQPSLSRGYANYYLKLKNVASLLRSSSLGKNQLKIDDLLSSLKEIEAEKLNDKMSKVLSESYADINKLRINVAIDLKYRLYGKEYYDFNILLLNRINKYGNGFVALYNRQIKDNKELLIFEEPHYLKIIYPKKEMQSEMKDVKQIAVVLELPQIVEGREIVKLHNPIYSDKDIFEFELYDYKLQDGDIVSVYVNGEWILKSVSLEKEPKKFRIKLNSSGTNYLLLHAQNLGKHPPNTVAMKYDWNGIKKEIKLESNLKQSQLVEILGSKMITTRKK